jgi:hypothetical protein
LLPGNPHATPRGFVASLALQGLIVWRFWNRSQLLWLVAVALALSSVLFPFLAQASMNAGLVLFTGFALVQAALLCMRPVLDFIWSRPRLR